MLLTNTEIADRDVRIELKLQFVEHPLRAAVELFGANESEAPRLATEKNIFGDRELRNERQLLMHDGDPGIFGRMHAVELAHLTVHANLALVGAVRIDAAEDVHESGFAGAIFADERVNLAGMEIDRNTIERKDARKALGDLAHFQDGGRPARSRRASRPTVVVAGRDARRLRPGRPLSATGHTRPGACGSRL